MLLDSTRIAYVRVNFAQSGFVEEIKGRIYPVLSCVWKQAIKKP